MSSIQKLKDGSHKRVARVRGIRGYSASHVIPERQPRPDLGTKNFEEPAKKENNCIKPVRISKAFIR